MKTVYVYIKTRIAFKYSLKFQYILASRKSSSVLMDPHSVIAVASEQNSNELNN